MYTPVYTMRIQQVKEPFEFEWDEGNSNKNWKSHGVTQQEAEQAFLDEHKFTTNDIAHSDTEPRFILIGKTELERLLYIVYTVREKRIRVISARDMTKKKEVSLYEEAA
jgi:uncharacterized DUF497 family protein